MQSQVLTLNNLNYKLGVEQPHIRKSKTPELRRDGNLSYLQSIVRMKEKIKIAVHTLKSINCIILFTVFYREESWKSI